MTRTPLHFAAHLIAVDCLVLSLIWIVRVMV